MMTPVSTVQGEDILRLVVAGHLHFQSLWAGVSLGVFEMLAGGPLTLAEIAEKAGLALQPARMMMANLVALGFVKSEAGRFSNSEVATLRLLRSGQDNLVDILHVYARIIYPGIEDYVQSLRENRNVGLGRFPGQGATLYERLAASPDLESVFQAAMAAMPSNRFLAPSFDLRGRRHLCDCGGGNGRNAIELARANPELRVTVFDHPTVCEKAAANIASQGLSGRIAVAPGNFLADPFPPGIDSVLYAHIGPIWSAETNTGVFKRAAAALPEGGTFSIYNMVPADDHSGPAYVTAGSVYFHALATGQGFMHSVPEYTEMLRAAGFSDVRVVRDLPVSHALITGIR
ncbi:MAG: methyltransferase [Polyangiaceae bacterium]